MNLKLKCALLTGVLSMTAYGASIDHIQTYAPEYLGNQAQNGAINGVSPYYNPAGTTQLEEGLYVNGGLQIAAGHEQSEYKGKEYKAIFVQPVPNISLTKVNKKDSTYFTFSAIAGGGTLKYKHGVVGTAIIPDLVAKLNTGVLSGETTGTPIKVRVLEGTKAEGSNLYAQMTLGKAYQINDKLSLSGGIRFVRGVRTLKGHIAIDASTGNKFADKLLMGALKKPETSLAADIDSKRTANGIGFVLGANYKVNEKWNIGMRYDSRVKLNFKAKITEKQISIPAIRGFEPIGFTSNLYYPEYKDGAKRRRDLPAILAVGTTYQVTDKWMTALSANYYFNKDAKMDGQKYNNGFEVAFGNEYKLNEKWAVLGSINYAKTGALKDSYNDIEYALDSFMLGTGVKYQYSPTLELTATVAHYFYKGEEGNIKGRVKEKANPMMQKLSNVNEQQKYKKSITAFGLGFTKKF
ncbi:OmpP1/FadL family transporter [Fusobacterium necrophorum]|uniref:OmpP1/FadL family transporter n=1 Tax=Fusobacterium necrophorum TaxID=859 RepID=UPI00254F6DEC|nr:outer membrane protein transport protein [Fusobacterium necrophorum]MDK4477303.1 outer membrane protein transport protein [Fusobacterium necrophorum]